MLYEGRLRGGLRHIIVYDELFDVGQFLMEILAAFLLFPIAWELLWMDQKYIYLRLLTQPPILHENEIV